MKIHLLRPKDLLRPSTWRNLSGLGKSFGRRGWISRYLPIFGGVWIQSLYICIPVFVTLHLGPVKGCVMCIQNQKIYGTSRFLLLSDILIHGLFITLPKQRSNPLSGLSEKHIKKEGPCQNCSCQKLAMKTLQGLPGENIGITGARQSAVFCIFVFCV